MSENKNKNENTNTEKPTRREALKTILTAPVIGGIAVTAAAVSLEESNLLAQMTVVNVDNKPEVDVKPMESAEGAAENPDGVTVATRKTWAPPKRPHLKEKVPLAQFGNLQISRMFLGGNLIGGWAHARDLIYVSDLVKAYHTKEKVFETFYLAEQCGINTFLGHYSLFHMVGDYWKWTNGKMQFIADCSTTNMDIINKVIDDGAVGTYMQGETTDRLVREGDLKSIEATLEGMRKRGVPSGLGAHRVETVRACVEHGIVPDFWMKTYHNHNYWSAVNPNGERDNIFCRQPDETKEFMAARKEPWIAFKVLAAGALRPEQAFKYAFEGGADFICVGMYDFQVVQNANTVVSVLNSPLNRTRDWMTPTLDRKQLKEEELEQKRKAREEKKAEG